MEKLKNWFAALPAKKKTAAIWGGIFLLVVVIIFGTSDEPIVKNITDAVTENNRGVWGDNAEEITLEGIGTKLASIQEQMSVLTDRDSSQNAQIMNLREAIRDFSNSDENVRNIYEMNRKVSAIETQLEKIVNRLDYAPRRGETDVETSIQDDIEDDPQEEPKQKTQVIPSIATPLETAVINDRVVKSKVPDDPLEFITQTSGAAPNNGSNENNIYVNEGTPTRQEPVKQGAIEIIAGDITAQTLMKSKPSDNYIGSRVLSGSLIPVTVITGVEAPTGKAAESGAVSSTLRINGPTIMPNGYRLDLTGCIVTANVKGQSNTERAYFRPDRLTCQYEYGEVDIPIKGYLTGKDGFQGFRGRVVSKQGKALLYGSIAGGIKGVGEAFGGNSQNSAIIGNVQDPYALPSSDQVLQGSVSGAVSESADFLTQYYQQKIQELHEVVEVKPMITGSIHILESFQLKLMESIDPDQGSK